MSRVTCDHEPNHQNMRSTAVHLVQYMCTKLVGPPTSACQYKVCTLIRYAHIICTKPVGEERYAALNNYSQKRRQSSHVTLRCVLLVAQPTNLCMTKQAFLKSCFFRLFVWIASTHSLIFLLCDVLCQQVQGLPVTLLKNCLQGSPSA